MVQKSKKKSKQSNQGQNNHVDDDIGDDPQNDAPIRIENSSSNDRQLEDVHGGGVGETQNKMVEQIIEDDNAEVIPPSPRGAQIEVDPLNESAVIIQPNQSQQQIIREIFEQEDDDFYNSNEKSNATTTILTTNSNTLASTQQQQQLSKDNISLDVLDFFEEPSKQTATTTVTAAVVAPIAAATTGTKNPTESLERFIENLPSPDESTIETQQQPPVSNTNDAATSSQQQQLLQQQQRFNVDIFDQANQGNLLPWAYAIQSGLIPPLTFDKDGFNLLHRATGLNQIDIVIGLIEVSKVPVDLRDLNQNQTALMVASHYGSIRIMKYLLDKGADVNAKDKRQFTPLMNTVMNRFKFQSIYLMSKGANLDSLDLDGCTLAHRAAFNNDVEMLQILAQTARDQFSEIDSLNLAPCGRAITNESHQAFEYLQRTSPIKIPAASFKSLENRCIVAMIEDEFDRQNMKPFTKRWFLSIYQQKPQDMAIFLYAALIATLYYTFVQLTGVLYNLSDELHYFCNVIHVLTVVLITYIFVFALKMECPSVKFKQQHNSRLSNQPQMDFDSLDMSKVNFKHLNRLCGGGSGYSSSNDTSSSNNNNMSVSTIEIDYEEESHGSLNSSRNTNYESCKRSKKNVFDWVAGLVENERFHEFAKLSGSQICFECLTFKHPRTYHCEKFDVCVPMYSHYSEVFGKLIVKKENHGHYYAILLLQWLLVVLFFVANLIYCKTLYSVSFESYFVFAFQEVIYIYFANKKWTFFATYLFAHVLLYLTTLFLVIETIAKFLGVTRFELQQPQKCQDFYQNIQEIHQYSRRGPSEGSGTYFRYYELPSKHTSQRNVRR